jgi:hypothetical protein
MTPYGKFRIRRPSMLGLVFAFIGLAGLASEIVNAATLPKDPCALLKPAEVRASLAPNETINNGVPDTGALPLGVSCTYTWGPRTKEWGQSALMIMVIDASKAWVGASPDLLKQGVLTKAISQGSNASVIHGIGDAAVFTFEKRNYNATAEGYFQAKDVHLSISFHGGNALQNKENVIALLKQAAARL